MRAIGSDVSFYQDDPDTPTGINFDVMALAGASFTIIRAGQWTWIDRDFKKNWQAAKASGIPRGSYWFYDSRGEPKKQAQLWISVFDGDFGELPLWADFEDRYGGPYGRWQDWYVFLEEVKRLTPGKQIGIYTAYYYWTERTAQAGIPAASLEYFKQYPLWVANYGVISPLVPKPWGANEWKIWQFTDKGDGAKYGAESLNIDLNYFNGTQDEFNQWIGLNGEPNPPPTEEPMADYYEIKSNTTKSRSIRKGPSVNDLKIGDLLAGKIAKGGATDADVFVHAMDGNNIKKNDTWRKVFDVDGVTLIGWIAEIHLGVVMIDKVLRTSTPAPDPDPEPSPTIPDVAITADTKLATVTIHSNIPMEIYYNGDKIR